MLPRSAQDDKETDGAAAASDYIRLSNMQGDDTASHQYTFQVKRS